MSRRSALATWCLLAALVTDTGLAQAPSTSNATQDSAVWENLRRVPPGSMVRLRLSGDAEVDGRVGSAGETAVSLEGIRVRSGQLTASADGTLSLERPRVRAFSLLSPPPPAQAPTLAGGWDLVPGLPVGTRLRLVLAGTDVTGTVVGTSADAVVLEDNVPGSTGLRLPSGTSLRGPVTFARADVTEAAVLQVPARYKVAGAPEPSAIHRVLSGMSIGRLVEITPRGERGRRGRLLAVDPLDVTIADRLGAEDVRIDVIPYADVVEVRPAGMSARKKIAIVGGVVGAWVAIAPLLCYSGMICQ